MASKISIEVCIDDPGFAVEVAEAGAQRIEMCSALDVGGLTPTRSALERCQRSGIPVTAMTRIRPGDFILDENDIAWMRDEIASHVEAGVQGIVLGALTAEGEIDTGALRWLMDGCNGLPVTFHRAFDHCNDLQRGLEQIIDSGCQRLLTSGGAPTVHDGIEELIRINEAAGDRIEIIAGGGVRAEEVKNLVSRSGISWVHLSGRSSSSGGQDSTATSRKSDKIPLGRLESGGSRARFSTDPSIIRRVRAVLDGEE